jgi:hypothetical protein
LNDDECSIDSYVDESGSLADDEEEDDGEEKKVK